MTDYDEHPFPEINHHNSRLLFGFFSQAALKNLIFTRNHDYNDSLCLFNEFSASFQQVLDRTA